MNDDIKNLVETIEYLQNQNKIAIKKMKMYQYEVKITGMMIQNMMNLYERLKDK